MILINYTTKFKNFYRGCVIGHFFDFYVPWLDFYKTYTTIHMFGVSHFLFFPKKKQKAINTVKHL